MSSQTLEINRFASPLQMYQLHTGSRLDAASAPKSVNPLPMTRTAFKYAPNDAPVSMYDTINDAHTRQTRKGAAPEGSLHTGEPEPNPGPHSVTRQLLPQDLHPIAWSAQAGLRGRNSDPCVRRQNTSLGLSKRWLDEKPNPTLTAILCLYLRESEISINQHTLHCLCPTFA
jgi:hypothetical protein